MSDCDAWCTQEALCRISVLKKMPSNAEIVEGGFDDAGQMLLSMRINEPGAYKVLVESGATPWGTEPTQPLQVCVEQLLMLIIRTVEAKIGATHKLSPKVEGTADLQLTATEVKQWASLFRARREEGMK